MRISSTWYSAARSVLSIEQGLGAGTLVIDAVNPGRFSGTISR